MKQAITGDLEWKKYQKPVILNETITYLERRSPYPTYQPFLFPMLLDVCDIVPSDCKETDSNLEIVKICPGEHPAAFIWALNRSEVGFLELQLTVEKNTIVDFINTDYLENNGSVKPNTYITRYTLQPSSYHLTTFEPKLVKYLKLIFRTKGTVNFSVPKLLNYMYPASEDCFFLCSDHDLNSIYRASKHTLKLNTLDIFIDCPQRERAGWLCDSYFTSMGAWQLLETFPLKKILSKILCSQILMKYGMLFFRRYTLPAKRIPLIPESEAGLSGSLQSLQITMNAPVTLHF